MANLLKRENTQAFGDAKKIVEDRNRPPPRLSGRIFARRFKVCGRAGKSNARR